MDSDLHIEKATDGIAIGFITLTDGKTSAWYSHNLADVSHKYFDPLEKPLGWDVKLLIICGHGRSGGKRLKGENGDIVELEALAAFIKANIKTEKILLNVCHGGDSGEVPGESIGNHLSNAVGCRVYAAVENIAAFNGRDLHFYRSKEYTWHRYLDNSKADIGVSA
jgi:hypothetical protein